MKYWIPCREFYKIYKFIKLFDQYGHIYALLWTGIPFRKFSPCTLQNENTQNWNLFLMTLRRYFDSYELLHPLGTDPHGSGHRTLTIPGLCSHDGVAFLTILPCTWENYEWSIMNELSQPLATTALGEEKNYKKARELEFLHEGKREVIADYWLVWLWKSARADGLLNQCNITPGKKLWWAMGILYFHSDPDPGRTLEVNSVNRKDILS